jgi:hypothetical protein
LLHPREEHDLVAASVTKRVLSQRGQTVGQHPAILPGSLAEREALALIDDARWQETRAPESAPEKRRKLRRHWREQRL